ncbi:MAG: GGDEF domain-containing protein [Thermodesulfobacteriota bacterium]
MPRRQAERGGAGAGRGGEPLENGPPAGASPGEERPEAGNPGTDAGGGLVAEAARVIREALDSPRPPSGLPEALAGNAELHRLLADVQALREFVYALADGDLSGTLKVKGFLAGALKRLQAHLKHVTWQTQMVAAGDFSQRLDFMGEFSTAFNEMTVQLELAMQQIRDSEERYRLLAAVDQLTGLDNRRHFFELAEDAFNRAERYARPVSLLLVDLDHFKQVNDRYGHPCGDAVLREAAQRLKAKLRDVDRLCRFGGEEFIGLLPDVDVLQAAQAAERLRRSLEQAPVLFEGTSIPVTASFGVSAYQGAGASGQVPTEVLDKIVAAADRALYVAKRKGRNQVQVEMG